MLGNLEVIFEQIIFSLSIIFIFIGFGGIIIVVTTSRYDSDVLLEFAYTFVYAYMFVLGTLLFIYRKKIIIKK